jgi:hypothetical protein
MHNFAHRFQCAAIILSDLLLSEGREWNRTFPVILKTGDQREVHVRFDEALNAAELIYFIM